MGGDPYRWVKNPLMGLESRLDGSWTTYMCREPLDGSRTPRWAADPKLGHEAHKWASDP